MKVTCVRPCHKKWERWSRECKHGDCLAAAVARRIEGPVTPGMHDMAEALKNVYDKYVTESAAMQQQNMLNRLTAERQFYGYGQAAPVLWPQEENADTSGDHGTEGSKPDRG